MMEGVNFCVKGVLYQFGCPYELFLNSLLKKPFLKVICDFLKRFVS